MWSLGSKTESRPRCECLVALPGVIDPTRPTAYAIIDLADWPHWYEWSWVLIGIDPLAEAQVLAWTEAHPDQV